MIKFHKCFRPECQEMISQYSIMCEYHWSLVSTHDKRKILSIPEIDRNHSLIIQIQGNQKAA